MIHNFLFYGATLTMKKVNKFFSITIFFFLAFSPLYGQTIEMETNQKKIEETQEMNSPLFDDDPIGEISYWKEFSRMMMILGFILGVVLLIAWLLRGFLNKRIKQINQTNIIKVLERRNLSQKSMIYLVEIYNKQYLIGDSSAGGVKFLADCKPSEATEVIEETSALSKTSKFSFMQILQRKLNEKQVKESTLKND
jgi:flagellar biogenesis protein FliO